jgi:hypothetical protein
VINAQPATPAAPTLSTVQPTCTTSTGTITVTAPLGATLTYNINNGAFQSSPAFSNLAPGTYQVRVKNADGCISAPTQAVINAQPQTPAVPTLSAIQPTCTTATGSITVTAPVGAGITYSINNGTYQAGTTFSNLTPGTYTVRAKSADGCVSGAAQAIINAQPATPAAPVVSVIQPTCSNNLGSVTVTSPTGAGYTYNINGGSFQSSATFNNLAPGTYLVRVKSPDGCTSVATTVVLNTPECSTSYCTYTQGYYGGTNGKSCDGVMLYNSPTDLIRKVLGITTVPQALNPIVVGVNTPGYYSITIPATDAAAIKLNLSLPGGSTSGPLTVSGNCVITDPCFNNYLTSRGKINNNLLSQTIVLTMNSRMNSNSLANLAIQPGWLVPPDRMQYCH